MAFDTSGIRLKPCVDLFSTEASRQDASLEKTARYRWISSFHSKTIHSKSLMMNP